MSRDRTNVVSIVVITICVTAFALVGGLLLVSRYVGEPEEAVVQEQAPVEAPAPKRAPRGRKSAESGAPIGGADASAGGLADAGAAADHSAAAATAAPLSPGAEDPGPSADADGATAAHEPPGAVEATPVQAADRVDARTIMEESQRRGDARFYRYDGLLQSFDAKNKMTEKRWTFDRVGSNGRSKSVLRFTAPAEVKGVALLIFNHADRASDQWMWTPALERDRRIALQDRSTRFFGTDFSFEDLEERDVEQYDYEMLGEEAIDGASCWKIQTTPKKSRASHYSRSIAWIRKDNYVMARLDNYVDDKVVKRLSNSSIENIQGIWTARQLEMADLTRSTRTRLTLQQVKYNEPMKDSDFTLEAIRR